MTTEQNTSGLAIIPETNAIDYSNPKVLKVIKDTIAPEATPSEFAYFLAYCQSTSLNPLKREVWFIKTRPYTKKNGESVDGKVQIMTGIGGFLAIANSHDQYDGMEVETLHDKNGNPIESVAKVWRKDRKFPSVGKARWAEDAGEVASYSGKPTVWGTRKTTMLEKVAKARALREAFSQQLNNIYLEEEFDAEERKPTPAKSKEDAKKLDALLEAPEQRVTLDLKTADELEAQDLAEEAKQLQALAAE